MMLSLQTSLEVVATLACAIFAGAALYINLVEHPARMSCGTELAVTQWAPSYERATRMQVPLAAVSFASAAGAWLAGSSAWWLVGGLLLALNIPFTLAVIMPVNRRIHSPDLDRRSEEARRLLQRWNRLHAVRTMPSVVALVILLLNAIVPTPA